jgi:putative transposase
VPSLGLSDRLRQSLTTTNAIESLISRTRHVKRNVKRWPWWSDGPAVDRRRRPRSVKGFRRLKGHKDMPTLVAALRARDQQLGLTVSVSNVA